MLYTEKDKPFDPALFEKPGSAYRCAPFWAWNCELKPDELLRQIDCFREMGCGGFYMHARAGLATPYLGPEFLDCVKACAEHAGALGMRACLYDEDRWPSGFAGGLVTRDPRFRQKLLLFTRTPLAEAVSPQEGYEQGLPYYLTSFDIVLDASGRLSSYRQIAAEAPAEGAHWFVYVKTAALSPRYNHYCYVDAMDPQAVEAFLGVTHERYKKALGPLFGSAAPLIFTDEPQLRYSAPPADSFSSKDALLSWTTDFCESFRAAYGYDLLPHLPEILWELPEGQYSRARYHYRDHVCERFTSAYCDRIGAWCEQNGILFTGHIIGEDRLQTQSCQTGECMRNYRSFALPGIDVLCDEYLPLTAKQAQSAVHQYGREGMSSELYGVTGWEFGFAGHKRQGDWQAALGVTHRVPHLAWASMKGRAKRDYPGSLGYQASWYEEYPFIEDHFARLNSVLTRGRPVVELAVLHPIESFWLAQGPADQKGALLAEMERRISNMTDWLLGGTVDFDFFAESGIPSLFRESADARFTLGCMAYRTVLIPPVLTLRGTTLEALSAFLDRGGRVVVCSEAPPCVDAVKSRKAEALWARCERVSFAEEAILAAVSDCRVLSLSLPDGSRPRDFLYNMREEQRNGRLRRWLFLTRKKGGGTETLSLTLRLCGLFRPMLYDTQSGQIRPISFRARNGCTTLSFVLSGTESLLLGLDGLSCEAGALLHQEKLNPLRTLRFGQFSYRLEEPNVLVLDQAEYSSDGLSFQGPEELLRIDTALRGGLNDTSGAQPWTERVRSKPVPVQLRFRIESECPFLTHLACEEVTEIRLNGQDVPTVPDGFFVDRSIRCYPLPPLREGRNELLLTLPFGQLESLENCFLLGEFGVRLDASVSGLEAGPRAVLTLPAASLRAGDLCAQGLPFYGGAVSYGLCFACGEGQAVSVLVPRFEGAVIAVLLDGRAAGHIAYAPCRLMLGRLSAGTHRLTLRLYLSRVNCFGALHERVPHLWKNFRIYYTEGDEWSYGYQLKPAGLLEPPEIEIGEVTR